MLLFYFVLLILFLLVSFFVFLVYLLIVLFFYSILFYCFISDLFLFFGCGFVEDRLTGCVWVAAG